MTRLLIVLALCAALPLPAAADERGSYYYPPITSEEVFTRAMIPAPTASREIRTAFTTQVTAAQLAAPESPRFVIFAKGSEAQHMVMVALDDQIFRTLYRARAVLAQLTSNARRTDFFVNNGIASQATWLDLVKVMGFEDMVISDGATWSHRIILK